MRIRSTAFTYGLALIAMSGTTGADTPSGDSRDDAIASNVERAADYGSLPLSFEANQGQTDPQVQFLTRGAGHSLFLTPSAAVLTILQRSDANPERSGGAPTRDKRLGTLNTTKQSVVRMTFEGADPHARVVGADPLPGVVNYFIGDDPSKWRTNVPTYQKVAYENVYPGIDLIYYGNEGQLEYDLIVAPGADPAQILLAIEGAEKISVDDHGVLVLTLPRAPTDAVPRQVKMRKPVVYQMGDHGDRQLLGGTYVLVALDSSANDSAASHVAEATPRVAFQLASYDVSKPLIIDPVLSWATYLGGRGDDQGAGIALDLAGNVYVSGSTQGSEFPGMADSSIQSNSGGGADAFITKINAAGTAIVYSTYLGGSGDDFSAGIAVDQAGDVYVTGTTNTPGSGFPGTSSSRSRTRMAEGDLASAATPSSRSSMRPATPLSIRPTWAAAEQTSAPRSPLTRSATHTLRGRPIHRVWLSWHGGQRHSEQIWRRDGWLCHEAQCHGNRHRVFDVSRRNPHESGSKIAVDLAGNVYVTGSTNARTGFPGTAGSPLQSASGGGYDSFVTKLNATGTAIVYSTYLGGNGIDAAHGLAVDATGSAYVTGGTSTTARASRASPAASFRAPLAVETTMPSSRSSTRQERPSSIRPIWAAAAKKRAMGCT